MSKRNRLLLFLLLLSMCSMTYWLHFIHSKAHLLMAIWHPNPNLKKQFNNSPQSVTLREESPTMPLASCPITSPHLLGPLHIQIDWNMTLETVRNELNPDLQVGGRYTPPDCNSLHKVAIIIPFRNRHSHLIHWLRYLHPILQRQQLDYGVYVINQGGEGTFNRAKLLNVGVVEALKEDYYSCFVFSDVDLIPMDDRNSYGCFSEPRHLAVAMDKFNFQMPYHTFFGGAASFSKKQYMAINGFPNNYWGWGGEDDDMHQRVLLRNMAVSRPSLVIGRYKMIKHDRDVHNEPGQQNPAMLSRTKWTMDADGINSLTYDVTNVEKDKLYTFITVDVGHPK